MDENAYTLHIVKDVVMWSIISSICFVIHLFSHENCFKWWAFMWPFDYWVMFSGGHVYSIFIPWNYFKWYLKIKASLEDTWEKISQWHGVKYLDYTRISPIMLGLYPDLSSHPGGEIPGLYLDRSYYAQIIPGFLLPSPQGLPERQGRWSRKGRCATMWLCSWTFAWCNASFASSKQASMVRTNP
jgi:hypothetical protein